VTWRRLQISALTVIKGTGFQYLFLFADIYRENMLFYDRNGYR
jgi:hypothetical protein